MKKLFWERSFDSVAADLVSIFIPIYLLRLHYGIQQVFLLYALVGLLMVILYPLGFKSVVKIGANRTMVLGNIGYAIFFLLLFILPSTHEPLWLIAIPRAMYSAFYFPAFTANFVVARAHRHTGTQIGFMNAITLLLSGVAPAVGGIIASAYGLPWLYLVVIVSIIVANVPLLIGHETVKGVQFRLGNIPWREYKDYIANGLYNFQYFVENVVWPITISLFIVSYSGIGLLTSVIVLVSITICLYVGLREDRLGERRYINEGVATGVVGNIGKLLAATPIGFIGVNLVSGVSDALLANAYVSRYYKNADTENMLGYIFAMEVAHGIGWAVYFGLLALMATWLSLKLVLFAGIIIAVPAIFGVRLIKASQT